MKKHDKDFVRKEFEKNGYELLEEYSNYNSHLKLRKDGYLLTSSYSDLVNNIKPIKFGKKCKYQHHNIEKYILSKNKDINVLDISNVKKNNKDRIIVKMKCGCGDVFTKKWDVLYYSENIMCNKCIRIKTTENNRKKNNKKYIKNIESSGYTILNKNQDFFANVPVEVVENNTGYKGFVYPNYVKNIKKIIVFSLYTNNKNLIYNINKYAENNNIKSRAIELIHDENNINPKIKFICECGEEYIANYRSLTKGKYWCSLCTKSKSINEIKVSDYLKSINIEFIEEYIIHDCRSIYPLRFDFFLKKLNILIEVDGEQHFNPIDFGKDNRRDCHESRFLDLKKRDNIKNEYCKNNNIPLLRISYKKFQNNDYKEIINNFIQTIQE